MESSTDSTPTKRAKIIIVGDPFVGKSSILNVYRGLPILNGTRPTIGLIDTISSTRTFNDVRIRLDIWDTASFERYKYADSDVDQWYPNTSLTLMLPSSCTTCQSRIPLIVWEDG